MYQTLLSNCWTEKRLQWIGQPPSRILWSSRITSIREDDCGPIILQNVASENLFYFLLYLSQNVADEKQTGLHDPRLWRGIALGTTSWGLPIYDKLIPSLRWIPNGSSSVSFISVYVVATAEKVVLESLTFCEFHNGYIYCAFSSLYWDSTAA